MAGPVENISARGTTAVARTEAGTEKTSDKFDQLRQDGPKAEGTPPVEPAGAAASQRLEHDLRKRLESAKSTNPAQVFGADIGEARKRIEQLQKKVEGLQKSPEASPLRDRLSAIEAQFTASEQKLGTMPDTGNLRDLLAMQNEMYKLGQSIEILSKVVDAATSGIKSTLQMQV